MRRKSDFLVVPPARRGELLRDLQQMAELQKRVRAAQPENIGQ